MTTVREKFQEGPEALLPARIHWTAGARFGCGLFLVAFSVFGVAFNESTPMGRDFWSGVSRMHLGPVFVAVILAGMVYALTGWM